jgi:simple sugar transport system permease protein
VLWWVIYRSRWGVLLRAAGERSEVLTAHGHRVIPIQYTAVIVGGMFAGVGGAHLSIAYTKSWFENMAQGRGFVAVAVVMFAALHPGKIAGGAYLFGVALALSPALQARGYGINQYALDAMPYLVTLLVLIATGRKRSTETPEGLSKVFDTAPAS